MLYPSRGLGISFIWDGTLLIGLTGSLDYRLSSESFKCQSKSFAALGCFSFWIERRDSATLYSDATDCCDPCLESFFSFKICVESLRWDCMDVLLLYSGRTVGSIEGIKTDWAFCYCTFAGDYGGSPLLQSRISLKIWTHSWTRWCVYAGKPHMVSMYFVECSNLEFALARMTAAQATCSGNCPANISIFSRAFASKPIAVCFNF